MNILTTDAPCVTENIVAGFTRLLNLDALFSCNCKTLQVISSVLGDYRLSTSGRALCTLCGGGGSPHRMLAFFLEVISSIDFFFCAHMECAIPFVGPSRWSSVLTRFGKWMACPASCCLPAVQLQWYSEYTYSAAGGDGHRVPGQAEELILYDDELRTTCLPWSVPQCPTSLPVTVGTNAL